MPQALSRPRRLLRTFALVAAIALASALRPVSTNAACRTLVDTTYYFDAALTQYAGHCLRACNGVLTCSGTITAYKVVEKEPCPC